MNGAVWQVSAGPVSRSYAAYFLKYGVALIGPGDPGEWTTAQRDEDFEGSFVRRFATDLKADHVLVLRSGVSTVKAIGIVASDDYLYLKQCDDINGWDLQHARRVRWGVLPTEHDFKLKVFGPRPTRFSRVYDKEVIDFCQRFIGSPPGDWQNARLPELPQEEDALDDVPSSIELIVSEALDIVPMLKDKKLFGDRPKEDELVAHFVVPLLKALKWQTEQIAVKWRDVDVTLFKSLPRNPDNIAFIIEAKRLGAGVEAALKQARRYLEKLGVARDVVVTDGVRYRMYDGQHNFEPVAYANLARLKKRAADLFARLQRQ